MDKRCTLSGLFDAALEYLRADHHRPSLEERFHSYDPANMRETVQTESKNSGGRKTPASTFFSSSYILRAGLKESKVLVMGSLVFLVKRLVLSRVQHRDIVMGLMLDIGYRSRDGGYTDIGADIRNEAHFRE